MGTLKTGARGYSREGDPLKPMQGRSTWSAASIPAREAQPSLDGHTVSWGTVTYCLYCPAPTTGQIDPVSPGAPVVTHAVYCQVAQCPRRAKILIRQDILGDPEVTSQEPRTGARLRSGWGLILQCVFLPGRCEQRHRHMGTQSYDCLEQAVFGHPHSNLVTGFGWPQALGFSLTWLVPEAFSWPSCAGWRSRSGQVSVQRVNVCLFCVRARPLPSSESSLLSVPRCPHGVVVRIPCGPEQEAFVWGAQNPA